jgi:hypothetical protein
VEITLAEGLHDWGRGALPLLNYALAFALQLRKSTENLSQVAELLETTRCVDLAVFLGTASAGLLSISPPRLPVLVNFPVTKVLRCVIRNAKTLGLQHRTWVRTEDLQIGHALSIIGWMSCL